MVLIHRKQPYFLPLSTHCKRSNCFKYKETTVTIFVGVVRTVKEVIVLIHRKQPYFL